MSFIIRPALPRDIPSLHCCLPAGESHHRRVGESLLGECLYLVAMLDGGAVGHVIVRLRGSVHECVRNQHPSVPEITRLLVRPDFRGQGIGAELLTAAEEAVAFRGFSQVGLAVGVDNQSAKRLYQRSGYFSADLETFESSRGLDDEGNPCVRTVQYFIKSLESRVWSSVS